MKKNYIAPNTEMMNLASEGIMQNGLSIVTGSGTSFSDMDQID
jgi:hypothetical protein